MGNGVAPPTAEERRREESRERKAHWSRWGPFLSERAWGTVREDYSPTGDAWEYFLHDHARSRAYRWNEDGLAGICDRHQKICFAPALWNGRDSILKERLFGLTCYEGNHGEDVKECYYYLDNTPTHSYMKCLYKYPQQAFPYERLIEENRGRTREQGEFELEDTGIFRDNRYFDVLVEYAKAAPDDILIRISVSNRGPEAAEIHVLPTVWFRNTWSWGRGDERPEMRAVSPCEIELREPQYGRRRLLTDGTGELLFTENETNARRLYKAEKQGFAKDGINDYVIHGSPAVNPARTGTKASVHHRLTIGAGQTAVLRLRLTDADSLDDPLGTPFESTFAQRIAEADEFYAKIAPANLSEDARNVMRQSFAGLLWSKQFYHYIVKDWLDGDPSLPPPPASRRDGRNHEWMHLYNSDVLSMPDKWEYPWFAAWDLAFHTIPLSVVDPDFAKDQLTLLLREWYMHPNGQLPAYEWNFSDVNPPVHAWAAWRVYKIEKKRCGGKGDRRFLERVFHKLLLNFTWWVNRKDTEGRNVFQGGFLGLDNIGVFDRSKPLPTGGFLEQADGTGWMAMYSLNLLAIAMELAREDSAYEDVASKFWEHFLYIANAMTHMGSDGVGMWDDEDGFFYDVLFTPDGHRPLKIRSMVGLIPLFAVETLEPALVDRLPGFKRRLEWFIENRKDLAANVASMTKPGKGERRLLSIVNSAQLRRVLRFLLDENEFLSPYGVRALSRFHKDHPYVLNAGGAEYRVDYEPGESTTALFGGNSNWRGPVWLPVNFLLIESLQKFHHYLGDSFLVECPTGSGTYMTLWDVAAEISRRLMRLFLRDESGRRPAHGADPLYQADPHWRDLVLFYEYFNGDTGAGAGASHQTGWTGLIGKLLQQYGE
jgi:Mannosylglycerate hydrolase MGH1-like glycoside hydrolase domain